jgi:hypothetical protein
MCERQGTGIRDQGAGSREQGTDGLRPWRLAASTFSRQKTGLKLGQISRFSYEKGPDSGEMREFSPTCALILLDL